MKAFLTTARDFWCMHRSLFSAWMRQKTLISWNDSLCLSKKICTFVLSHFSTKVGMSREKMTLNPWSVKSQPMTSSDCFIKTDWASIIFGASFSFDILRSAFSPHNKAAAMPSPKSEVPIRLLFVLSSGWNVRLHSSAAMTSTKALGYALQYSAARASPLAPPAQPSPQIGIRFVYGENGSSFISRASILGVERPVLETKKTASTFS